MPSGVFWTPVQSGTAASAPFLYRTDIRTAPFTITTHNHTGSSLGVDGYIIRAVGVPDRRRMLAIHRVGLMVMLDGITGSEVGRIAVGNAWMN